MAGWQSDIKFAKFNFTPRQGLTGRKNSTKFDLIIFGQTESSDQMSAAVGEIKKLNDQLSQLRQENINLKVSVEAVVMVVVYE